eukprot:767243-Pyramimonas_sp.AAC.1
MEEEDFFDIRVHWATSETASAVKGDSRPRSPVMEAFAELGPNFLASRIARGPGFLSLSGAADAPSGL